jgi:hypothetical protein
MSAVRVEWASSRDGAESAGGVLRRAGMQRYWVIAKDAKDRFGQLDLLAVDLDGTGEALAVVSILYGPCADVGRVVLDPLPEIGASMQIRPSSLDRRDFVESVMGARSLEPPYKASRRTV